MEHFALHAIFNYVSVVLHQPLSNIILKLHLRVRVVQLSNPINTETPMPHSSRILAILSYLLCRSMHASRYSNQIISIIITSMLPFANFISALNFNCIFSRQYLNKISRLHRLFNSVYVLSISLELIQYYIIIPNINASTHSDVLTLNTDFIAHLDCNTNTRIPLIKHVFTIFLIIIFL